MPNGSDFGRDFELDRFRFPHIREIVEVFRMPIEWVHQHVYDWDESYAECRAEAGSSAHFGLGPDFAYAAMAEVPHPSASPVYRAMRVRVERSNAIAREAELRRICADHATALAPDPNDIPF